MAPGPQCTGLYKPQERLSPLGPWHDNLAVDHFVLETPAHSQEATMEPLRFLSEKSNYDQCINGLSKNKQPGPDLIPNELISCLPWTWHITIHKMFQLMWVMSYTPSCWKNSNTCMLYKKGDPTAPKNIRPIGLNNTMAKLWTCMVTVVMTSISENNHILSDSQDGFRENRNTHRQLTNLLHQIEDSKQSKQDLFAAFNMIDHDK